MAILLPLGMIGRQAHSQPQPASQPASAQSRPEARSAPRSPATTQLTDDESGPFAAPAEQDAVSRVRFRGVYVPVPRRARVRIPKPPWKGPEVRLAVGSGYEAGTTVFGYSTRGAVLGGDVQLRWSRNGGTSGIGLALGLVKGVAMRSGHDHTPASRDRSDLLAVDAGFLLYVRGFWFMPGIGYVRLGEGSGNRSTYFNLPEIVATVGYDCPLGEHFALRLRVSGATLITSARGELGGGLVVRF